MTIRNIFIFIFILLFNFQVIARDFLPDKDSKNNVLILPDMGNKPILEAISSAQASIDLALYRLEDPETITALIEAAQKGVKVRVILQKPDLYPDPFANTKNKETIEKLAQHNIKTHYLPDHYYALTHYKFMIIDKEYAFIQTFNFDSFNFKESRNFGLVVRNKHQIDALVSIFNNDYNKKGPENDRNVTRFYKDNHIILGPEHQREALLSFLQSAKHAIYIYQQDITDPQIGETLRNLSLSGIKVHVLMTPCPFGKVDSNVINHTRLTAAGGKLHFRSRKDLYVHAKVIILDPEQKGGKAYVGSCNFWPEALSRNREMGIVTQDPVQVTALFKVFLADWKKGKSYETAKKEDLSYLGRMQRNLNLDLKPRRHHHS